MINLFSIFILEFIVVTLHIPFKFNMFVDHEHLTLEMVHGNHTKVILALVTVDKFEVHDAWLIVGLRGEIFVLVLKTWLQELRV